MFFTTPDILHLLEQYKYLILFPIMVLEGPIITVISGFLVRLGLLNLYITIVLLAFGDLIGDILHYLIGKYGKRSGFVRKIAGFLGYNESKEKTLEEHFKKHTGKTLLMAKVSHGVGGIIQIASGVAGVNLFDFIWFSFLGTIPKTLFLFVIGYYLGNSYQKIDGLFDSVAIYMGLVTIFVILFYLFGKKYVKKLFSSSDSIDKK